MGIKMVKEGDKKFNQAIEKVLSAAIAGAYSTKEATYATLQYASGAIDFAVKKFAMQVALHVAK